MPDTPDLATRKLQLEVGKLQAEIPKLRREAGWRATVVPLLVSLAAVSISGAQIAATLSNNAAEANRKERELQLDCLKAASDTVKLLMDHWDSFNKASWPEKVNYANTMLATLPPPVARRMLKALAARVDPIDVTAQSAFLDGITRAKERADELAGMPGRVVFPCDVVEDLSQAPGRGEDQHAAVMAETDAPPTPSPDTPASSTLVPAKPHLLTFYQVTRRVDRGAAKLIATAVAEASARPGISMAFPAADAVEWVHTADLPRTQVRYYRRDQENAARLLADLITAAGKGAQPNLAVEVRYIGGIFPNLPEGRIEVWFQPLGSSLADR